MSKCVSYYSYLYCIDEDYIAKATFLTKKQYDNDCFWSTQAQVEQKITKYENFHKIIKTNHQESYVSDIQDVAYIKYRIG